MLGNDTAICADKFIILDPKVTDGVSYLWHPSGATTPTLHVDSAGYGLGQKSFSVDVTNSNNCTGTGTIKITFKDCTGIGSLKDITFRMYPNPNNGQFTIELNSAGKEMLNIDIINISGATVYSMKDVEVSGFVSQKMNLGNLGDGTYLVRLSIGNESTLTKLVITK
jgi:hypothetical protein